jgi:hypothetical protein
MLMKKHICECGNEHEIDDEKDFLVVEIDQCLSDFRKSLPRNIDIDEDSFEGSAYYLLAQAKKALIHQI